MFENTDVGDIAWVAGLFEGEGCITISRNNNPTNNLYPRIWLAMVDKDIIARLDIIVGAGTIYTSYLKSGKREYKWGLHSKPEIIEFIATVWPYLGERRRAKAIELGLAPV